ncbi:MAG: hypothetical protein HY094_05925 [Candidatus Melainabacteria bacterium]|nr:hypothetical protein [Candidatus Melainabacteria bacterium]
MPIGIDKVFPLTLGKQFDLLNALNSESYKTGFSFKKTKVLEESAQPSISTIEAKKVSPNGLSVPEKPKKKLSPFEVKRELLENNRKSTVTSAIQFLQVRKVLGSLTRNLERISDSREEKDNFGFNQNSKAKPDQSDLFIKKTAKNLVGVLNNIPTYQNVQVVMGFIEMVKLIDKLEGIGMRNEIQTHEFGFHPFRSSPGKSLDKPKNRIKEIDESTEALKHARKLRETLPILLSWLEFPESLN